MTPRRIEAVMPISALLLPWLMGVSVPLRSRVLSFVLSALPVWSPEPGFVVVTVDPGASVLLGLAAGGLIAPGFVPVAIIDVAPVGLAAVAGVVGVVVAALPKATALGGGEAAGAPGVSAAALDGS
jgi:hypothetical protein